MSNDRRARSDAAGRNRPPAAPPRKGASRTVKRALARGPIYEASRIVLRRFNYLIMGGGVLAFLLGFALLHTRDITLAPLLIVLGYCILIPAGLLIERVPGRRQRQDAPKSTGE
jgi:hypothetical protein